MHKNYFNNFRCLINCFHVSKKKYLPDYWTANKNIFKDIDNDSLNDYEATLSKILNVIKNCQHSENILGKYICKFLKIFAIY